MVWYILYFIIANLPVTLTKHDVHKCFVNFLIMPFSCIIMYSLVLKLLKHIPSQFNKHQHNIKINAWWYNTMCSMVSKMYDNQRTEHKKQRFSEMNIVHRAELHQSVWSVAIVLTYPLCKNWLLETNPADKIQEHVYCISGGPNTTLYNMEPSSLDIPTWAFIW